MKTNRTAQLIYQSFYCALGLVAIFASFGIFDDYTNFRWDFYVHFTNQSNYLCIAIMFAQLIQTAKKKEDSYITAVPLLKFVGMLAILLTFVVFNALLAGAPDRDPQLNWRISSVLCHVLLPILFVGDWFLFRERGKTKWYYPIAAAGFPLYYVAFLLVQAVILKFDTSILIYGTNTPLIYPYFFVNLETQGIAGVAKWTVLMFVAFMAVGFVVYGVDRLLQRKSR